MLQKLIFIVFCLSPIRSLAAQVINCPGKPPEVKELFEARLVYNLTLQTSEKDISQTITKISNKMAPLIYLKTPQINNVILSVSKHIQMSSLAKNPMPYLGCTEESLSERQGDTILVDETHWKNLDLLNQAAFLFTESFAAQNRTFDRKFISFLFSTENLDSVQSGLPATKVLCLTKGANSNLLFYAYPDKGNAKMGTWFQFWSFGGFAHFTKSRIFFPELPYKLLGKTGNFQDQQSTATHFTESKVYSDIPILLRWDITPNQKKFEMDYEIDGALQTVGFECE